MKLNRKALAVSLCLTLLFALLLVCSPLYLDGDNYALSTVKAEKYGSDTYCNYISGALNLLLSGLHGILPAVDWFSAYLRLSVLCGLFILLYLILTQLEGNWGRAGAVLALGCLFLRFLVNSNYTQTAGFLMIVSLVCFSLYLWGKTGRTGLVASALFAALAFLGRSSGALLILPYFGVAVLHWAITAFRSKKNMKRLLGSLAVLIIPGLILTHNSIMEHSAAYQSAVRYDKARQTVEDYPTKAYEDLEEVSFTETQYQLVKHWNLLDTAKLNTDILEEMALAGRRWQEPKAAFLTILDQIRLTRTTLLLAGAVSALALFFAQNLAVLTALCAGWAGTAVIMAYFALRGRLIERVTLGLLAAMLALGLVFLLTEQKKLKTKVLPALFAAGAAALVLDSAQTLTLGSPQLTVTANRSVESIAWQYEEPADSLYIWDYNGNPGAPWQTRGKLPPSEYLRQNLNAGSWHYGHAYFDQMLAEINAANPLLALVERPHTYYMGEDAAALAAYLEEAYGLRCQAAPVGEKQGKTIWQLQ